MDRKIFSLGGPTGVGKDTVKDIVLERCPGDIVFFPRTTTRNSRPGETHGTDYFFVRHEEFQHRMQSGAMTGVDVHKGDFYGIDAALLNQTLQGLNNGHRVFLVGGISGIALKQRFPGMTNIFLSAEREEIERRLRQRERDASALAERIRWSHEQLAEGAQFDISVENPANGPDAAACRVLEIMGLLVAVS